jgi:asparagine synthase (glutamine-hydrolysing)
VSKGIKAITGIDMPVFPKRRFQHGAMAEKTFQTQFPRKEVEYRKIFESIYE